MSSLLISEVGICFLVMKPFFVCFLVGGGVKNRVKFADVLNEWSLMLLIVAKRRAPGPGAKPVTHCYFIRLNPKRISPF